jgi:hypothetical protein
MQNEKLKEGDEVYHIIDSKMLEKRYYFQKVVRLTATQAILTDDWRLKNKPAKDLLMNECFNEISGNQCRWYRVTEQVKKEAAEENKRQNINYWFNKQQFNDSEKAKIYSILSLPPINLVILRTKY